MAEAVERESMDFDVVIVGAGPAGLSAAIRIKQLAAERKTEVTVVVLEKGSEVGAHILSGAVMDPRAMNELIPDWKVKGCPYETEAKHDKFLVLGQDGSIGLPVFLMPPMIHNHGMYVGSLASVCRWLAKQAEDLGVEIYPGFAGSDLTYREDGSVKGIVAGVMGIEKNGERGPNYTPGMELNGKYVLIAEGVRGSLAKRLIREFKLEGKQPQKFGIGIKELWQVPAETFKPGLVQHTFGWPLDNKTGGGSFMYHFGDRYVSIGLVVHLNYKNPWISPFEEFQRFKHHPEIARYLNGGTRIAYGSRAITEGGWQSIPKLTFPGGALIGCSAGFMNVPRIKGSHNAMKSGMLAGEAAFEAVAAGRQGDELAAYPEAFEASWVAKELKLVRNAKPLWSKFGTFLGAIALSGFDLWCTTLLGGFSFFGTQKHGKSDAASLEPASKHRKIVYPKPDGVLSFDRLTSVAFSFTNHGEDQPPHLKVKDLELQKKSELGIFGGPSNRYCPAGVYEWVEESNGAKRFQINAQNCVHCKTCDIKDPNQNITWTTPEGGGGPNYPNM